MTNLSRPRYKNYRKEFTYFNRRRRIRPTLHVLNLRRWDNLIWRKNLKRRPYQKENPWRLNWKSKQEIKAFYGNISESQFQKLNKKNRELLISKLERRLDVMIFKLNWALSIYHARQLIRNRHILVNGKIIKTSGYLLQIGDLIQVAARPKSRQLIKTFMKIQIGKIGNIIQLIYKSGRPHYLGGDNLPNLKGQLEHWLILPMYLEVDYKSMSVTLSFPNPDESILIFHPLKPYRYWKIS